MSKDINLQIEITYGDVAIERVISSKTTIRVNDNKIVLEPGQVNELYRALRAYVRADEQGETHE